MVFSLHFYRTIRNQTLAFIPLYMNISFFFLSLCHFVFFSGASSCLPSPSSTSNSRWLATFPISTPRQPTDQSSKRCAPVAPPTGRSLAVTSMCLLWNKEWMKNFLARRIVPASCFACALAFSRRVALKFAKRARRTEDRSYTLMRIQFSILMKTRNVWDCTHK